MAGSIGVERLLIAYGLLFLRCAGILVALPGPAGISVPAKLRLGLAALLAFLLAPATMVLVPARNMAAPIIIAGAAVREIVFGLGIGIFVQMIYAVALSAGEAVGLSMELNSSAIIRPGAAEGFSPNILADAFSATSAAIFFLAGCHRALLGVLIASLHFPLGTPGDLFQAGLLAISKDFFQMMFILAAPLVLPLFVVAVAQGVVARLVPQVNVMFSGVAALIAAGVLLFYYDAGLVIRLISRQLGEAMATLATLANRV